ncbi:aldehyde dehydrogenase [Mycolicibacter sinensis]|uniref:Aldehyde dehydrogenase n=1 Tax=Mycolicibacter sinensis (strain JDM601) TaxID=875328 RepID=A0A1A3TU78_MYCSD|nr:aldehyde dehydrogenase [Mycolicibacter sinensis]OBK86203.1 aldehyde dehydrogenase [Mycolicibacter sinensis]
MYEYDRLFIGGEWVAPASPQTINVVCASTEERIGVVPKGIRADADAAVAAARLAFDDPSGWAHWPAQQRAAAMFRLADAIEARSAEFTHRVSSQNGMPVRIGRQTEGAQPAMLLRYYADLSADLPAEETRQSLVSGSTVVRKEPVGVVAAIVPWNFPQSLTMFKLAPALAAGCTVVLKPSSETVLDAFLLAEAVKEADLPPGLVNVVTGSGRDVGAHLVSHPDVDKVAFTGSTEAGRTIAEQCGRLLKPVTLELGGKSAGILLDDVDLSCTMKAMFGATLLNNGQTCFISTRILAPRTRYPEVVDAFSAMAAALPVGNALEERTLIGPVATPQQRDTVEAYIAKGKAEGGRITAGGGRPPHLTRGWFIEPTVFADVDNDTTIAREEIFGPVLTVIPYTDDAEAVRIANDSAYGLGGTVWTADPERGLDIARRVHTGSVGVNGFTLDPGSPFGGVKASGLGRELGPEGLAAYQQLKSVYLPSSGAGVPQERSPR